MRPFDKTTLPWLPSHCGNMPTPHTLHKAQPVAQTKPEAHNKAT
jgi:hypothetical protein